MGTMRFEPLQKNLGFEIAVSGALPWQMLPRGGARGILLLDAPDYELRASSLAGGGGEPGGLTFAENTDKSSKRREIWLSGQKKGKYELQVISMNGPPWFSRWPWTCSLNDRSRLPTIFCQESRSASTPRN